MKFVVEYLRTRKDKKQVYKLEKATFLHYEDANWWKSLKEREGCKEVQITPTF